MGCVCEVAKEQSDLPKGTKKAKSSKQNCKNVKRVFKVLNCENIF